MNANPYVWLFLFILAVIGMGLALHQDMKSSTKASNLRWGFWFVVMAILAMFDTVMLAKPWERL